MENKRPMLRINKNITPYLIISLICFGHETRKVTTVNTTHILNTYVLVCGFDYLCDPYTVSFTDRPKHVIPVGYKNLNLCQNCSCDLQCVDRRDCCPDVLFGNPEVTCTNFAILGENINILAVTSCPASDDADLKNSCVKNYTNEEKFTLTPVSSKSKATVYRNQLCAECHGENETEKWELKIICKNEVDLNHLSSYDDIYKVGSEHECSMSYEPPFTRKQYACSEGLPVGDYNVHIAECNETGLWPTYDPDIEWACNTFSVRYRMYKNVFCYMCNPGEVFENQTLIESCNITGLWSPFDATLEFACVMYPKSDRLFPFKNRFCYLCNRANNINLLFLDAKTSPITETALKFDYNGENEFYYKTLIEIEYFYDVLTRTQCTEEDTVSPMSSDVLCTKRDAQNWKNVIDPSSRRASIANKIGMSVNIQKLVEYHYLHFGYQYFCNSWLVNGKHIGVAHNLSVPCACDISCVQQKNCCFDFAISAPVTKFQSYSFPISKCMVKWKFISPFISLCEKMGKTIERGYLLNLPVRSRSSQLLYKNMFCFLCNEHGHIHSLNAAATLMKNSSILLPDPFDVSILCDVWLDLEKYVYLEDMVMDALSKHCKLEVVEDFYGYEESDYSISTCNQTGNWTVYDADMEWACENYFEEITPFKLSDNHIYRNLFCKMCNEGENNNIQYTQCNMTGLQKFADDQMERDCEYLPHIKTLAIHKNRFCLNCNPSLPKPNSCVFICMPCLPGQTPQSPTSLPPYLQGTFYNMFSITTFTNADLRPKVNEDGKDSRCGGDEIYDSMKKTCKKYSCANGKSFSNGQCSSLLEYTRNLGYIYAVRLQGNVTSSQNTTVSQLVAGLQVHFPHKIADALFIPEMAIDIKSLCLFTENVCERHIPAFKPFDLSILVHASFYIKFNVHRDTSEGKLLNLTRDIMNISWNGISLILKPSFDDSAFQLPTKIYSFDYRSSCYWVKQNLVYDKQKFKLSFISKLLTCKQVNIDSDQFRYNKDRGEMALTSSEKILNIGEFMRINNGGAVICEDDFEEMLQSSRTSDDFIFKMTLGIISISFVCLSLLALLVTFITYCVFPRLQTLPGKNNMSLMFALFFAQGLNQFGLMQTSDSITCTVLGILIHYFWLATFFCMNVCSFHMFKLFVLIFKSLKEDSVNSNVLVRYILYCYGTPAFVIICHIVVSVTVTDDHHIGYGRVTCFVSTLSGLIVTFIVPVFTICIVNAFLFAFTTYKLKTSPKMSANRASQKDLEVYLKLFVLTGITWILQLIESFFPPTYFSILVAVVNASQGIFIFLSYCANKRVRKLYKSKFLPSDSSILSTTTSTKTKRTGFSDETHV